MGKTYLVDYENTGAKGLSGCDRLQSGDRIILFFTKNNSKIDMSIIADHGEASFQMIEVSAGKQSADFHICSYLGYLLAGSRSPNEEMIIVSNDTDFDNLLKFWKGRSKASLKRVSSIGSSGSGSASRKTKEADKKDSLEKAPTGGDTLTALSSAGFSQEIVDYTVSVVARNAGEKNAKQQIYRTIISKYGQKQGLEIYSSIKKTIR